MNKVVTLAMIFAFLFLFVGYVNSSAVLGGPSEITMRPNESKIIKITILNEGELEGNFIVQIVSDLKLNQDKYILSVGSHKTETFNIKIISDKETGYYTLIMGVANENVTKTIKIKVSQMPLQIKKLMTYYEDRLDTLKLSLNATSEDVKILTYQVEDELTQAKIYYTEEDYDSAYSSLEKIREDLEKIDSLILCSTNETRLFEIHQRKTLLQTRDSQEVKNRIGWYIGYALLTILIILVLYFGIGRKKFIIKKRKVSIRHLKSVNTRLHEERKQAKTVSSKELKKQITSLGTDLKKLSKKKEYKELKVEFNLIKEKYDKGMYKMCQEYIDSLKERMGAYK